MTKRLWWEDDAKHCQVRLWRFQRQTHSFLTRQNSNLSHSVQVIHARPFARRPAALSAWPCTHARRHRHRLDLRSFLSIGADYRWNSQRLCINGCGWWRRCCSCCYWCFCSSRWNSSYTAVNMRLVVHRLAFSRCSRWKRRQRLDYDGICLWPPPLVRFRSHCHCRWILLSDGRVTTDNDK